MTTTYEDVVSRPRHTGTVLPRECLERSLPGPPKPPPYAMTVYSIRHSDSGTLLGDRVELADGPWARLKGLIGRKALQEGEGLMLTPCQAVHMYGVRYAVDVVFLDESYRVVATYEALEPGKRTLTYRDARYALKLPSGTATKAQLQVGDRVEMEVVH